ncbi:DUF2512 family protein [Brevibacillus borstelensis]|jgi:hypothetical protein|uniref:DUF2512 family protein n=1 Tax=Brevibacillus borstelensis TaxID=45462 RepID=UPI0003A70A45|nr:DUF2512 family protein [Brevibacillus borstelensis]GED54201.1 hypothetical protein BBO01nite_34420 [Brevibacillus borstelensis]
MPVYGLLVKLITAPLVVVLADALFPEVDYATLYQSIGVGLVLAVAGHMLELLLLRRGTLWMSTAADMILAFLVVWLSSGLLVGARITLIGAGFTAILFGAVEYIHHVSLIKSGRAEKT